MTKVLEIQVDKSEHATILAALRFYQQHGQGEPSNRSDEIHEIATCGDECVSLDADAIDALCEDVNCCGSIRRILPLHEALQAARGLHATEPCAANLPLHDRLVKAIERLERTAGARALLAELVEYEAEQFDDEDDGRDLSISGADTVDWLGQFRLRARAVLGEMGDRT